LKKLKKNTKKAPKKKPAKKQLIQEIPVDAPKKRGRPAGAVGAKKRESVIEEQPPVLTRVLSEPVEITPEMHMQYLLQHSRQLQASRQENLRNKYRSWVA
jgi:hypothetical protein